MKKRKDNNVQNNTISEESKGEIQELFDELFLNQLSSSARQMDEKIDNSSSGIDKLLAQEKNHYLVISELIGKMNDTIKCIGNAEDWNDDTLLSAINTIIDSIYKQADSILNQTDCLVGDWGEETLLKRICSISENMQALMAIINSIEQRYEDHSLIDSTKVYNQLRQIDGIIGKLSNIELAIDTVEKSSDAKGREDAILEKQEKLMIAISSCQETCLNVQQKSCELCNMLLSNENELTIHINNTKEGLIEKTSALQQESNALITTSQEHLQKLIDKKICVVYLAIGAIGILNIITIVLLLIK